jgi:hypothetical protein
MKNKPPLTTTIKHNSMGVYRLFWSVFRKMLVGSFSLIAEFFKALKDVFFPKLNIRLSWPKKFITRVDKSCKEFIARIK